jgi:hypothetical protein
MIWKQMCAPVWRIGFRAAFAVLAAASLAPKLAHSQAAPAVAPAPGTSPGNPAKDARGYTYLIPHVDLSKSPKEINEARAFEAKGKTFVRNALQNGITSDRKSSFDLFFNTVYFPYFAPPSDLIESGKADIAGERLRLLRDYLEVATNSEAHAYLANMVYTKMKGFIEGPCHPAVRYNAMLTISLLNDVEPSRLGNSKSVPEPMLSALPFIYEQFTKPENNDAIRVAALLGLVRHLEWDNFRGPVGAPTPAIAGPLRTQIVKTLLDLAGQTTPPDGRDPAGHEWMRRRAIEGLTHAGYHQATPELIAAMDALVKNDKESLAIRTTAATAMGIMAYPASGKLELTPTAKELGFLALVACDKELARVTDLKTREEDQKKRLANPSGGGYAMGGGMGDGYSGDGYTDTGVGAGTYPGGGSYDVGAEGPGGMMMPGGMMPGGMGPGFAAKPPDPKQYRFDYIRRKIRSQLYAVEVALGGPEVNLRPTSTLPGQEAAAQTGPKRGIEAIAAGQPDLEYIASVKKGVADLVRVVETTTTDFEDLEKDLRKKMKPLEAITRKLAEATPVAPVSEVPELPEAPMVPEAAPSETPPAETPAAATETPAPTEPAAVAAPG